MKSMNPIVNLKGGHFANECFTSKGYQDHVIEDNHMKTKD